MKVKTTVRYDFTTTRPVKTRRLTIPNFGKDAKRLKPSYTADRLVKGHGHFGKRYGPFY